MFWSHVIFFLHLLGDAVIAIYMPIRKHPLIARGGRWKPLWPVLRRLPVQQGLDEDRAQDAVHPRGARPSLFAQLLDITNIPQVLCFLPGGATEIWISSTSPVLFSAQDYLGFEEVLCPEGVL